MRSFCRFTLLTVLVLLLCASSALRADDEKSDEDIPEPPRYIYQGKADKRLAGYQLLEGFRLDVVADSEIAENAQSLGFAPDGRLCLLVQSTQKASESGKIRSRVVVFTSSRPGREWTTSRTLIDEENIRSFLWFDGWLYLFGKHGISRHRSSKPDGPLDRKEVVVEGIAFDPFASVGNAMSIGPDGWLYFGVSSGNHFVRAKDGSQSTLLATGGVFRCLPQGGKIEVFVRGLVRPFGAVHFDGIGNPYVIDSGVAGSLKQSEDVGLYGTSRLLQLAEGIDFGWRQTPDGKRDPFRVSLKSLRPGTVSAQSILPLAGSIQAVVYSDDRLPEEYQGSLLDIDAKSVCLRSWSPSTRQAREILQVSDRAAYHLVGLTTGPDGALYLLARPSGSALSMQCRVYQLRWTGTPEKPELPLRQRDCFAKISSEEGPTLLKRLASPIQMERDLTRTVLARQGERNRASLMAQLRAEDTALQSRLAAIGALMHLMDAEVIETLLWCIREGDSEVQRLAADALGRLDKGGNQRIQEELLKAMASDSIAVRRAVILAMGKLAGPGAADSIATALAFDTGKDRLLFDAYLRALEKLGKPGMSALLALGDSGRQRDTDRMVEAYLGFREAVAYQSIVSLLRNPHLDAEQQTKIIRSALNYQIDPPISLEPVFAYLTSQESLAEEVKQAMLDAMAVGIGSGPLAEKFALTALNDDSEVIRQAALKAMVASTQGCRRIAEIYWQGKLNPQTRTILVEALKRHARKDIQAARLLAEMEKR